jgi:hypothetical protein
MECKPHMMGHVNPVHIYFSLTFFLKLSRLSLKIMINSTINLQKQKTLNPSQRVGGPHTIDNHKLKMKLEVGFAKMLQDSIPLFS